MKQGDRDVPEMLWDPGRRNTKSPWGGEGVSHWRKLLRVLVVLTEQGRADELGVDVQDRAL